MKQGILFFFCFKVKMYSEVDICIYFHEHNSGINYCLSMKYRWDS